MDRKSRTLYLLLFLISIFVTACSGGGGNGGAPSAGGPGPGPGPNPGPLAPETRLFYTQFDTVNFRSVGLWAVNPDNPSAPVQAESEPMARSLDGGFYLHHGQLDAANQKIVGLHTRTVIYATNNGKLYKVSALKSDSLTPVQVSSEASATRICQNDTRSDFSNHNNSVYLYLADIDTNCSSGNEVWKMVRIGMGASENPITITPKRWLDALQDTTTGAIIGWLATDGQSIVRCDQNFENCTPVSSFTSKALDVELEVGDGFEFKAFTGIHVLQIDNKLYAYNVSTRILSSPLYTCLAVDCFFTTFGPSESDLANYYFADGASQGDQQTLLKLTLDGVSNPTTLTTESGNIGWAFEPTTTSMVYGVSNNTSPPTRSLRAISKNGGTPIALASDFSSLRAAAGGWIYYDRSNPAQAGAIREDGTGGMETPNAGWAGNVASDQFLKTEGRLQIVKVLKMEGCSASSCAGGNVKALNAATNSNEVILGTLPSDIRSINLLRAIGEHGLAQGYTGGINVSGPGDDIFYVKPGEANSMVRVTNTPAIREYVP